MGHMLICHGSVTRYRSVTGMQVGQPIQENHCKSIISLLIFSEKKDESKPKFLCQTETKSKNQKTDVKQFKKKASFQNTYVAKDKTHMYLSSIFLLNIRPIFILINIVPALKETHF